MCTDDGCTLQPPSGNSRQLQVGGSAENLGYLSTGSNGLNATQGDHLIPLSAVGGATSSAVKRRKRRQIGRNPKRVTQKGGRRKKRSVKPRKLQTGGRRKRKVVKKKKRKCAR